MELEKFKKILFEKVSDSSTSIEDIEFTIKEFYSTKPIPLMPNLESIVRCRPGKNYSNVSELSYNPIKSSIKLQRCNYPEQQVFYGAVPTNSNFASSSFTAIVETAMEYVKDEIILESFLTLSRWKINRPLKLYSLPFSKLSCEKNNDFREFNNRYLEIFDTIFGNQEKAKEYFIQSLEYMSDIFCEIENKLFWYKISSAFYNVILNFAENKRINVDGLLYPSANTEAAGINVALNKKLVDDKILECDYIQVISLKRSSLDVKQLTIIPYSKGVIPFPDGHFDLGF